MDRRTFARALPVAAAAAAASYCGRTANAQADAPARVVPLDSIGIQLYTLRSLLSSNVEGTLASVAAIGYREVEFAGLHGKTPAEMRQILDRVGLRAVSSHHSMRDVRQNWQRVLDEANTLGQRYVVIASLDRADRTPDRYRIIAEEFNTAGEAARNAGLHFGFHNHDAEFERIDDSTGYDVLLERTNPSLVAMELDLYWIVNAGRDPISYFDKYAGRFHLVHVKDRTAAGEMVNVGAGVIDFRAIFARAREAGIRHYLVEHDRPASPLDDVRASHNYLRRL
jgi:sugar phosphate isomerase/epimerase